MLFDRLMKRTSFQAGLLFGLALWIEITLCGVVSISAQTRAIKPVRIEAKTAQNETVSYIYAESHALVIGVSQYRNGWSNLPGVQDDVEEVSQSLKANGFQVTTIKDPGLDELETAIEDFIFEKGAKNENRLLIYYAGHGHTMTLGYGGEMGFLVPADAPVPEKENQIRFQRKVLSMQRIEEVAKSTSAKHVLFMFDACFAGSVFLATRAAPAYIQQNTKEPVRQFITSGSAEQEVPDKSIFRRAFVDALNGKADYDKDGYLTGTELGAYIQKRTAEDWEGRLTPQYGKLQDPNLNKGDFVFELSKPEVVKPPPAEPVPVAPPPDLAAQAWSMIENSENPKAFELFLQEFPESAQASLAKLKLMLLLPPVAAIKKEEPIPESQNEVVEASPVTPLPEPITPPLEQSVVISNETGSNSRYSWTAEIVEDKEKGLIWQRKDGGERSFSGAQIHCNKLSLDEADNWRVPKFKELSELLKGEFATEIFGKISRGFYWATNSSGTEIFDPWEGSGRAALLGRYNTLCVRDLVNFSDASNSKKTVGTTVSNSFGNNERYRWTTEIVEDKKEELIWQRQETGKKNFVDAQLHCEGLQLVGASDWRLPLMSELRELNRQITSDSEVHKEIFNQPIDSFFWSGALTDMGTRVWTINLWTGRAGRIDPKQGDQYATMCVRSSEVTEIKTASNSSNKTANVKGELEQPSQKGMRYFSYNKIVDSSSKVIGCGFFHVGCEEKALTFPNYQPGFHIKGYRRVNLWGKDRPWTDTELQLQNGDQVYFYGTGEVTTCPHSSCSGRGPQNLNKGSLSYKISEGASPGNLNRFTRIRYGSSGFKSSIQARSNGALYLSVRDWNTYPPPSNYYDDNSGVYILDIFVIDPKQEEGFNRFKDALFKVNPNDSNAKAYLGR